MPKTEDAQRCQEAIQGHRIRQAHPRAGQPATPVGEQVQQAHPSADGRRSRLQGRHQEGQQAPRSLKRTVQPGLGGRHGTRQAFG